MHLDGYLTFVAATMVLLLGRFLIRRFRHLKTYNIPEPVAGGLAAAVILLLSAQFFSGVVTFDTRMQTPLMLAFFATIGLQADIRSLATGGRTLVRFFAIVLLFLVLQNLLGVGLATLLGLQPVVGLIAGSITLSGGHGTGAAWAQTFIEQHGIRSATEMAVACATFGLVLGGLIGGPVARFLIHRSGSPGAAENIRTTPVGFEQPATVRLITAPILIETLALIAVCLSVGQGIAVLLRGTPFELPVFVPTLLVGVLLRNGLAAVNLYEVFDRAVSVVGNVSLALFLVMALMSLQLAALTDLAVPILVLLGAQTLLMAGYVTLITYRLMGGNYDAIVLAAGQCGFGLGGTPTAIANMQAITDRYGPSHTAFIIVPLIGAFFLDIANAVVIKLFLVMLS